MKSNYGNSLYDMYIEEHDKNNILKKEVKNKDLEIAVLRYQLQQEQKNQENKIKKAVEEAVRPIKEENENLKNDLTDAIQERERLKECMENNNTQSEKDYIIDKLTNQVNIDYKT